MNRKSIHKKLPVKENLSITFFHDTDMTERYFEKVILSFKKRNTECKLYQKYCVTCSFLW